MTAPPAARAQLGGETCATTQPLATGDVQEETNTAGHVNDYDQGGVCTGFASAGPDVVYRIVNGASFDLTFVGAYDASIYLITDCGDPAGSCVAGSDAFPPGVPDRIVYFNDSPGRVLYLIIDGFGSTDFGPGALTGTIGHWDLPPPIGACCSRSTGGCSITTVIACEAANGIFQGAGTTCNPTPCPPAESRCILPGLTVSSDPSGDSNPPLANPQQDIQRVLMAEPYAGGSNRLVVTMKVDSLAADPLRLPLNRRWTVSWVNPEPEIYPKKFVRMTTCNQTALPSYEYGHAEPQAAGGDLDVTDGAASGTYRPDGTIQITIDPALVGNPPVGSILSNVVGATGVILGAGCAGPVEPIDQTPAGSYGLEGNGFCTPFSVTCPEDFVAGLRYDNPLDFEVHNPSIAPRRFDAVVSDARGWIVGGPVHTTVNVAPGGTSSVPAVLHPSELMPGDDAIELVVTASDLPSPDDRRQCTTTANCCVIVDAVADDGSRSFSFGLAGSNPLRGPGALRYSLPKRSPVRIEVSASVGSGCAPWSTA